MEKSEKTLLIDSIPVDKLHAIYREVVEELELRNKPEKLSGVLYRIAKAMLELQVAANAGDTGLDMRDEALMLYAIAEAFENG